MVDNLDEATRAVEAVGQLNRKSIRQDVVDRFSHERMVDDYVGVYKQVLAHHRAKGHI